MHDVHSSMWNPSLAQATRMSATQFSQYFSIEVHSPWASDDVMIFCTCTLQAAKSHAWHARKHTYQFFFWRHCVAQQTDIHKYITRTTHSHSISTHGPSTFTEQSHLFSMQCGWMWLSVRSNKPFHLRTFFFVIFFLYFLWLIQQQKKLKWKTTTEQIEKQKKTNNSVGYH